MTIVEKSVQPAQAPPERTLSDVFEAVTQLRDEVAALWEKLAPIALYQPRDPEAHLPEACRAHTCTYWTHYLVYGGPDLVHEAYHEVERRCEEAQKRCIEWCEAHEWAAGCPFESAAKRWETKVRA